MTTREAAPAAGNGPPSAAAGDAPPSVVAGNARLEVVDVLRGFALSGLFLVHVMQSFELYWANPQPSAIMDTVFLLFLGKSFTLLALCFGFSFFILMDRAARRGVDFSARFAWRLLVLATIGYAHSIVYRGDIIQILAAMGLLLLIAHRVRSNRVLLWAAGFCLVGPTLLVQLIAGASGAGWANGAAASSIDPGMPVYLHGDLWQTLQVNLWPAQRPKYWFFLEYGRIPQILGLYLLGMVLGRIGFFARLRELARPRAIALAIAVPLTLALYFGKAPLQLAFASLGYGPGANRAFGGLLGIWFELAATAVWVLVLIALYQGWGRTLLRPFTVMGRLTLTLYIAQSVVFVPIFYNYGLGLHDDLDASGRLALAIAGLALQMWFANEWLKRFQFGPLEWLWRAATYLTWDVPFKKKAAAT